FLTLWRPPCSPLFPYTTLFRSLLPFDFHRMDFFNVAVVVRDKFLGGGEVNPRISPEDGGGFLLAVVETVYFRPFRPRIILLPLQDRKSTRLNSSHVKISYAVFC